MKILRPYCWILSLIDWIKSSLLYGDAPYISGHDYVEQKDGTLKCARCLEESKQPIIN